MRVSCTRVIVASLVATAVLFPFLMRFGVRERRHDVAVVGDGASETSGVPKQSLAKNATLEAILHLDAGIVAWELLPQSAPLSVANFVSMARRGVFNQSCFYRYEVHFVLQGGLHCSRPPPFRKWAHTVPLEHSVSNSKWTVALARSGDPHSGGTEFFINLSNNRGLDHKKGGYVVFARVSRGMEVLHELMKLPTVKRGLTLFVTQPIIHYIEIKDA